MLPRKLLRSYLTTYFFISFNLHRIHKAPIRWMLHSPNSMIDKFPSLHFTLLCFNHPLGSSFCRLFLITIFFRIHCFQSPSTVVRIFACWRMTTWHPFHLPYSFLVTFSFIIRQTLRGVREQNGTFNLSGRGFLINQLISNTRTILVTNETLKCNESIILVNSIFIHAFNLIGIALHQSIIDLTKLLCNNSFLELTMAV